MSIGFFLRAVVLILFFSLVCFKSFAEKFIINSESEFQIAQNNAKSNDSVIWRKGDYFNVNLILTANHIYFLSEGLGETIFSGSSTLTIEGDGNTVSGFQFVNGKIEGDVVDISGSNNTIEQINIQSYDSHYYLRIRPNCQYNKIVSCNFESKPENQESSVVQIEATEHLPGYHVVSYCSFKNHTAPMGAGGDFGIEALRIGYSYQRTFISRTIVEYCYFEKCNGDYEVISNKACENVIRYNTFMDNGPAHLTLRHGSRAMVYGNFFINGAGVRIKEGQSHAVVNNYFDTGNQFSIHLQNHHFDPVDTVAIANNTFVGSGQLLLGAHGEFAPKNVLFVNNIFSEMTDSLVSDPTGSERWYKNAINIDDVNFTKDGFIAIPFAFEKNKYGFYEPEFDDRSLNNYQLRIPPVFDILNLDDDYSIDLDIMKQRRVDFSTEFPGCYITNKDVELHWYANSDNTGPAYLH